MGTYDQRGEADVPLFETKSKTCMISAHKSYSSKIQHSSCYCGEQYGTVKKRRRNRLLTFTKINCILETVIKRSMRCLEEDGLLVVQGSLHEV